MKGLWALQDWNCRCSVDAVELEIACILCVVSSENRYLEMWFVRNSCLFYPKTLQVETRVKDLLFLSWERLHRWATHYLFLLVYFILTLCTCISVCLTAKQILNQVFIILDVFSNFQKALEIFRRLIAKMTLDPTITSRYSLYQKEK